MNAYTIAMNAMIAFAFIVLIRTPRGSKAEHRAEGMQIATLIWAVLMLILAMVAEHLGLQIYPDR